MTGKRGYGEACPVAHSLDVVGDRWALLVVRELRLGPKRFSDLQAALPGAGPNMLAQVYELTEWGAELEPVFVALARWGMRSPLPRAGRVSADSMMLGLRTFFDPGDGPRWTAMYEFHLDRDVYRARVVDGRLAELVRGDAGGHADVVVAGPRYAVGALLEDGVLSAGVAVTGDREALERLLAAVPRPAPVAD